MENQILVMKLAKLKKDNPYLKIPTGLSKAKLREYLLNAYNMTVFAANKYRDNLCHVSHLEKSMEVEDKCDVLFKEYLEINIKLTKIMSVVLDYVDNKKNPTHSKVVQILDQLQTIDNLVCDSNDTLLSLLK